MATKQSAKFPIELELQIATQKKTTTKTKKGNIRPDVYAYLQRIYCVSIAYLRDLRIYCVSLAYLRGLQIRSELQEYAIIYLIYNRWRYARDTQQIRKRYAIDTQASEIRNRYAIDTQQISYRYACKSGRFFVWSQSMLQSYIHSYLLSCVLHATFVSSKSWDSH